MELPVGKEMQHDKRASDREEESREEKGGVENQGGNQPESYGQGRPLKR